MTSPHGAGAPASPSELPPAPMATANDSEFPRIFGNYALLAAFAQGGMGEVFLAKSGGVAGIDRLCVLKKLRRDVTQNPEYVRRFLDEVRVAVQLNHANICHIFDMGQVREEYFLAMEYVSGVNLRKLLVRASERAVVLDEEIALYVVRETLEALDYAHRHRHPLTGKPLNLVHRDVSPQNVMLNYEGEVKLIDFGLADSDLKEEQTESKVVMGKVAYMSPEQARGDRVDGRTDQFAAGIIAYELLVGERYYGDKSAYEIWQVVGRGTFVPARWDSIDPRLQSILGRALEAKVGDRYASCGAFQDALDAYMNDNVGRKGAQRLMRSLFEKDHDAERRFLKKFADVRVPSSDELSPREGSGRPFVLDDRSRPTTLEEAAALAEARVAEGISAKQAAATRTITAQDAMAQAQTGAPIASDAGPTSDPTEIVRSRTDVAAQSRSRVVVESSDTRAAAAAAYPNRTNRWLALAALVGVTLGVLLFLMFRDGAGGVDNEGQLAAEKLAAEKLAADKLAAEKLGAEKLAAEKLGAEKLAADKLAAEKLAAEKLAADKLAAEKLAADKLAATATNSEAKAAADKARAEAKKRAADKAAAKLAADKAAAKAAADKAAKDKAAAEQLARDKAAAAAKSKALPKSASTPFSYATARNALRGCKQICAVPQLRTMEGKSGTIPMAQRTGILNCAKRCQ